MCILFISDEGVEEKTTAKPVYLFWLQIHIKKTIEHMVQPHVLIQ